MAKFAYNNAKNVSIVHTLFELNYEYYPRISFEDKTNLLSRSFSTNKLANELRELVKICC